MEHWSRREGTSHGAPPTARVSPFYLEATGPEEAEAWADAFTRYHKFTKELGGHLHQCGPSCWKYLQDGDIRLCRHLFYVITRLRLLARELEVCLRTPRERELVLENKAAFELGHEFTIERVIPKRLKEMKYPSLRKGMLLVRIGEEAVATREGGPAERQSAEWHDATLAQLRRVLGGTGGDAVKLTFLPPEQYKCFVIAGKRLGRGARRGLDRHSP